VLVIQVQKYGDYDQVRPDIDDGKRMILGLCSAFSAFFLFGQIYLVHLVEKRQGHCQDELIHQPVNYGPLYVVLDPEIVGYVDVENMVERPEAQYGRDRKQHEYHGQQNGKHRRQGMDGLVEFLSVLIYCLHCPILRDFGLVVNWFGRNTM